MEITALTGEHLEDAALVLFRAFEQTPSDAWSSVAEAEAEVREAFAGGHLLLGAFEASPAEDGTPANLVGWIGAIPQYVHRQRATGWELHPLAVVPTHQGARIGARLVAALEEELRGRGANVIYLGTDDESGITPASRAWGADETADAIRAMNDPRTGVGTRHPYRFYLRIGYRVCGLIPDANGPGLPDIVMCKRLDPAGSPAFDRHARALRDSLERYRTRHPDEHQTVDRFLGLLGDGEDAFHRHHERGHFTASALVFDPRLTRVLLTHHRKLDIWIQLGGHPDGEADLRTAAEREAIEESGLQRIDPAWEEIVDIDIHPIPRHGGEAAHEHYDVRYAFVAPANQPLVVSDESHDLAWVRIEQLREFSRERSLHRAVSKAVSVLKQ
jgi:8-oxo-dGTP pyrophosphatase MutT (NUDIX family)/predicted N-acetyltransferase YhbS